VWCDVEGREKIVCAVYWLGRGGRRNEIGIWGAFCVFAGNSGLRRFAILARSRRLQCMKVGEGEYEYKSIQGG
jgi:hypothetical protein